jgi:flagellar hook-basal body complex protein FliE
MVAPIPPIQVANPSTAITPPIIQPASPSDAGSVFQSAFHSALNTVEQLKTQADQSVQSFLSGENEDVHTAVLAVQRADLSFSLFQQVRNRVVAAYQEVMKLQV